ncbi:MAG: carboxypeptidase regulatory-like domain-containing protein [Chitinophagaceae bacterium]|nr:carboxypeptidase regulatory-like domain-containing protein [Chitinophagaceae bacterium]
MRRSHEANIGMFNSVYYHLSTNQSKWVSQTALKQSVNLFKTELTTLGEIARDAGRNIAGVAQSKEMMKQLVISKILALSGKLVAFASTMKYHELKKAMSYSKSGLNRLGAAGITSVCNAILKEINTYAGALEDYGIVQTDIEAFSEQISEYEKTASSPRNAASSRKALNLALKDKISEIKIMIKEQLDTLMRPYRDNDKVFYEEYRNNRVIIDPKTSFTQLSGIVTNAATNEPVKNALVSIPDTNYLTNTRKDGTFNLRIPQPGTVKVKVELFGYEAATFSGIEIKLGKNTELPVTLKAV